MRFDFEPADGESARALEICKAVRDAGGRAFLVGGLVRDRVRGVAPERRDLDLEVHAIEPEALRRLLRGIGRVDEVGQAFAVWKLGGIDVSLPRRDSKAGRGHRGIAVTGDPWMGVEEASRRRDFTVNAMLWDPLTGEVLDPFGGEADLRAGVLRAVDPATFPEDSLRVLRGVQFAARFGFSIDPATVELCRGIPLDDLPAERIWGEMEKLLLAPKPSVGLAAALETGVIDKLFPELRALVDCPQNPDYHPEGDVWIHTLQAMDVAAELTVGRDRTERLTVMLAVLCHDLGKPVRLETADGRLRTPGHEEAGAKIAEGLLRRLKVHSIRGPVLALVRNHLRPFQFHQDRDRISNGAFRRLAMKCDLDLLSVVSEADTRGRRGEDGQTPRENSTAWFRAKAEALGVLHAPPPPILLGRHLLELGMKPGPEIGRITKEVYRLQLDGEVTDLEGALAAARKLLP